MAIVTFYRGDPKNAPKPTMPAHLGANAIITCGGVKKSETTAQGMVREIYEELGIRVQPDQLQKLQTYGDPGRIAAFQDGSVWRMVIVVYGLDFPREPQMRISAESRELRFFTKEELKTTEIAVTHQDIVEDWFLNR